MKIISKTHTLFDEILYIIFLNIKLGTEEGMQLVSPKDTRSDEIFQVAQIEQFHIPSEDNLNLGEPDLSQSNQPQKLNKRQAKNKKLISERNSEYSSMKGQEFQEELEKQRKMRKAETDDYHKVLQCSISDNE